MSTASMPEIPVSEARRRLPKLLRRIDADPSAGYRIVRRKKVVAELRSPSVPPPTLLPLPEKPGGRRRSGRKQYPTEAERMNAGAWLLKFSDAVARHRRFKRDKRPKLTSFNYKEYLYGKNGVLGPRSGR